MAPTPIECLKYQPSQREEAVSKGSHPRDSGNDCRAQNAIYQRSLEGREARIHEYWYVQSANWFNAAIQQQWPARYATRSRHKTASGRTPHGHRVCAQAT